MMLAVASSDVMYFTFLGVSIVAAILYTWLLLTHHSGREPGVMGFAGFLPPVGVLCVSVFWGREGWWLVWLFGAYFCGATLAYILQSLARLQKPANRSEVRTVARDNTDR